MWAAGRPAVRRERTARGPDEVRVAAPEAPQTRAVCGDGPGILQPEVQAGVPDEHILDGWVVQDGVEAGIRRAYRQRGQGGRRPGADGTEKAIGGLLGVQRQGLQGGELWQGRCH